MGKKIAIIAGAGSIPLMAINACKAKGQDFVVIALAGIADTSSFADVPFKSIKLGRVGEAIKYCKSSGVDEVVLIGSLRRPSFKELSMDLWTARKVAKISFSIFGDDSILSAVIREIEKEGLKVKGIQEILPELLVPAGLYTKHKPGKRAKIDINRGMEVLQELGKLDIGQSAIIQQGMVIGVEAIEGTDALIKRCKDLMRKGEAGVLVKMKKVGQETRVDLPTIGVTTVENAHASGLQGIAFEAGATLVVDFDAVVAKANELGLFLIAISKGDKL
jgi:hypothetical protein